MLRALALGVGDGAEFAGELITGEEGLDLVAGHLNRSRRIADRIMRACRLARSLSASPATTAGKQLRRPRRTLRANNRGKVLPGLLPRQAVVAETVPLEDAVRDLRSFGQSMSRHAALDFITRVAGLPVEVAARVLQTRGLTEALRPDDGQAVQAARRFWDLYSTGRVAFALAVSAMETPPLAGHWALFESSELTTLLPGLKVPRLFRRRAYLANLVSTGNDLCLDLHAFPSGLPLFRHPFRD